MGRRFGDQGGGNWSRGCVCLGMDRGSSGEALLSALDRPYIPFELQKIREIKHVLA